MNNSWSFLVHSISFCSKVMYVLITIVIFFLKQAERQAERFDAKKRKTKEKERKIFLTLFTPNLLKFRLTTMP